MIQPTIFIYKQKYELKTIEFVFLFVQALSF